MATKAKIKVTTSYTDQAGNLLPPKSITDFFSGVAPDTSKYQKENDDAWKALVNPFQFRRFQLFNGSQATWVRYVDVRPNCYNIDAAQAAKRIPPKTIAEINNGVCSRQYGYGFFQDAIGFLQDFSPKPEVIVTLNLAEPVLLGSYTSTWNQIAFVKDYCSKAGIKIAAWQLGDELGIDGNRDIFPTSESIRKVTQDIIDYLLGQNPAERISVDANLVDDTTFRLRDLNSVMNNVKGNFALRQYFQKYDNTYDEGIARVDEFPKLCDLFQQQFTHGQMMRIEQAVVKATSPVKGTIGEGIIYAKELIVMVKENVKRNIIADYHIEVGRFVSDQPPATTLPCYQTELLMRNALIGSEMITVEYVDTPNSEFLTSLAVKKVATTEVYIVNPTANEIQIESVKVDSQKKKVNSIVWFGDPNAKTNPNSYTYTGTLPLIKAHSVTQIIAT